MPKAKEKDPAKLGAYAKRLLASMGDDRLCMRFEHDPKSGQTEQFWLEPSGKRARPDAARKLIAKGIVRPLSDCLFADATPQTFERAA